MRPRSLSYTPADDNLTGFASNQSGAAFTLAATTPNDGDMAHLVIVTNDSATDHSAKTLALVGTDADGFAQTETMAAPGSSVTSTSTKYWKTLTSVTPSATIGADTFDIGWTDDVVSKTFPLDFRGNPFQIGVGVDISGTIDYTLQFTVDELRPLSPATAAPAPSTLKWWNHEALTALTADAFSNFTVPVTAARVLINSLTAGATIALKYNQGG